METASLKSFATLARTALIREVAARIAVVLAPASPERVEQPKAVAALEKSVTTAGGGEKGRLAVADRVAYIWFNRIIALRFMDANGYTGIGVASPQAGVETGQPEILAEAKRGNIDDTVVSPKTRETVMSLLNGARRSDDPQGEAYALLLAEYCRHWNRSMPFMFEREGDFTELLIPANLLADDSVLNRAVKVLTANVCEDVEVIGWLYQFYISERKDEVFAGFKKNKKAGADAIPAATQLFTPHWIVRYLVENSLGRLWMLNHPSSRLIDQMEYYIVPIGAETDFLKINNPEEIKVIDPACGSGHMLTYAFDLLYAIYEEEGYTPSEIPRLILADNLYGVEIDPRAGALAAFALTMKARARQRTFFSKQAEPSVCVLEPIDFTPQELDFLLTSSGDRDEEIAFWNQFQQADTLGALVKPNAALTGMLLQHVEHLDDGGDLLVADIIERAQRVVRQAEILSANYAVAVANPPYMGSSNMGATLEDRVLTDFPDARADLFAAFIERCLELTRQGGLVAMIAKQNWLFRPAFAALRKHLLAENSLHQVVHFGAGAFDSISGEIASTAAFVLESGRPRGQVCWFARLVDGIDESAKETALRASISGIRPPYRRTVNEFLAIPGAPVCYWMSDVALSALAKGPYQGDFLTTREGMATGNNARYLRLWWEVSIARIGRGLPNRETAKATGRRWFPYNKAGGARRWYGFDEYVVDWSKDGHELQTALHPSGTRIWAHNFNLDYIFREFVSWSSVTSKGLALRYYPQGFLFADVGPSAFADGDRSALFSALAFANSASGSAMADLLNPTHHFKAGDFSRLPAPRLPATEVQELVEMAITVAQADWEGQETAPGYIGLPELSEYHRVADWIAARRKAGIEATNHLVEVESQLQRLVADALGESEDSSDAPVDRSTITLHGNADYVFGTATDSDAAARSALVADLVSFAVGCMFGRYCLDKPGLLLADHGANLRDHLAMTPATIFAPDADNVIPIVDGDWFEDDIVARFRRFIRAALGELHFEENLRFVADSLGVKDIRDYFVKSFYKDHWQRYKKRPIYWLFSSPKDSFNALIYMHRYTSSTVSTVLNEYLREFKAKLESSLQHHERLVAGGGTARQQAAAQKEVDRLRKVLLELEEYEHDVLYPLASRQISIDLDDGVKVNYPKFGAALKKIPGLETAE